mgnify:FL=1
MATKEACTKEPQQKQLIEDDLEENPEKWNAVPASMLGMFGTNDNTDAVDKTNWDALDYSTGRDINWYRKRFGGFGEDVLEILAHCDGTNTKKDSNGKNHYERKEDLEEELKKKLTVSFD